MALIAAKNIKDKSQNVGAVPSINTPSSKTLEKGQLLFSEGESSRAMFYIKSGMLRIFKKRASSNVEIGTIRAGQIVGELAFLDGEPRSASAEAISTTELVEISGQTFSETLEKMPEWIKILLKTIVGRLRAASNKIRQLENVSTAYVEKNGKRTAQYIYLSTPDILRTMIAIHLVSLKSSSDKSSNQIKTKVSNVERYANQMMNVPLAKISSIIELLVRLKAISDQQDSSQDEITITDLNFIEKAAYYLNDQNLMEPSKRSDLSLKGFVIMSLIAKHLGNYPVSAEGIANVNLAEIIQKETKSEKEPFRLDDFSELIKLGYGTNLEVKSSTEVIAQIRSEIFIKEYRLQRLVKAIAAENEAKQAA